MKERKSTGLKKIQMAAFSKKTEALLLGEPIVTNSQHCTNWAQNEMKMHYCCVQRNFQLSSFQTREKHPWILPKHRFTELLVPNVHNKLYYSGVDSTLTEF